MTLNSLTAISPIDGRYHNKTHELRQLFSEFGLIKYRLLVEIRWLQALAQENNIKELKPFTAGSIAQLEELLTQFDIEHAQKIKEIEASTNHDVKAVEYFLQQQLNDQVTLATATSFTHFACTSEDINNLAYACILQQAQQTILLPKMDAIISNIKHAAQKYANDAMMAHTHGQSASPTTFGKEMAIFATRLQQQRDRFAAVNILGKCNGATGNYNAHVIAYPNVDWERLSQQFVESLGLSWNRYTTQIEPHDFIAELMHAQIRFNNILIDFSRDIWSYVSLGYLKQKLKANEVGSSTMPHKVNPINFENAEGNLGIANAVMEHLANKLSISRLQRDLTDSTILRNLGVGFAHTSIAYQSLNDGMEKLELNTMALETDLDNNWEVLAEAIQTVMRRYHIPNAYEQLKALTRGNKLQQKDFQAFIAQLDIPPEAKQLLQTLTPKSYTGIAAKLAQQV